MAVGSGDSAGLWPAWWQQPTLALCAMIYAAPGGGVAFCQAPLFTDVLLPTPVIGAP
jgi:hypothetical protein